MYRSELVLTQAWTVGKFLGAAPCINEHFVFNAPPRKET